MNGRVFFWVGGASGDPESWDNYMNWADVSNGAGGSGPGGGYPDQPYDIAIIDDNSDNDITHLNTNITIAALINLSDGTRCFAATDYTLTVGGMIVAGANGKNSGYVTGSAIFSGSGTYSENAITGCAIFSGDYSTNSSSIAGASIFSGSSGGNDGSVEDAIFSGTNSTNTGIVGYNSNSAVMVLSGSSSYNGGTCNCHAVVTGGSAQSGGVLGACILDGGNARLTGAVNKGAIIITGFNDVQTIYGGCIISATTADVAWNEGTINGGCILGEHGKNSSASGVINDGCLIVGPTAKNVSSGVIAGPCIVLAGSTFTNSATISGTLLPLTTFTNSGTLSGKKPLDVLSTGLF